MWFTAYPVFGFYPEKSSFFRLLLPPKQVDLSLPFPNIRDYFVILKNYCGDNSTLGLHRILFLLFLKKNYVKTR